MKSPVKDSSPTRLSRPTFSPSSVASSPVTAGRNLTGVPRLVRDTVADIHANIQKWNELHLNGLSLLKKIISIKVDTTYSEELKEPCAELQKVCNNIDELVECLRLLALQMTAITALNKSEKKLFTTWSNHRFVSTSEMIYMAYKKEAIVKRIILENVAHDHRDSFKMLHLAAWVHQVQILDNITISLESMFIETKLRN